MREYGFWFFLFIWWVITTADWAINIDTGFLKVVTESPTKVEKKEETDIPKPNW